MFSVIIFECDNSVAVIPNCWIKEIAYDSSRPTGTCYWPPKNVARAAASSQEPQSHWKVFNIRILKAFGKYIQCLF